MLAMLVLGGISVFAEFIKYSATGYSLLHVTLFSGVFIIAECTLSRQSDTLKAARKSWTQAEIECLVWQIAEETAEKR